MQNQHTKPSKKLAFEEPWIHHHSGGVDGKEKEKLSLLHTAFHDVTEVVENVKNETHSSICNYKNMLLKHC